MCHSRGSIRIRSVQEAASDLILACAGTGIIAGQAVRLSARRPESDILTKSGPTCVTLVKATVDALSAADRGTVAALRGLEVEELGVIGWWANPRKPQARSDA